MFAPPLKYLLFEKTSLPKELYTLNLTTPFLGIENFIIVDGLNGFG